jgi:hypothetical protein
MNVEEGNKIMPGESCPESKMKTIKNGNQMITKRLLYYYFYSLLLKLYTFMLNMFTISLHNLDK